MGNEDCAECGARRSRRFSVRNESKLGIYTILSLWTVKRAKARAPLLNSTSFDKQSNIDHRSLALRSGGLLLLAK